MRSDTYSRDLGLTVADVQPICSPTRSALMTGRYTIRLGTQANVIFWDTPWGVPLNETFLSQNLKDAGYTTAIFGSVGRGVFLACAGVSMSWRAAVCVGGAKESRYAKRPVRDGVVVNRVKLIEVASTHERGGGQSEWGREELCLFGDPSRLRLSLPSRRAIPKVIHH